LPVSRSFAALAAEESRLRAVVTDFDEESERQLSTNRLQDVNLVGPRASIDGVDARRRILYWSVPVLALVAGYVVFVVAASQAPDGLRLVPSARRVISLCRSRLSSSPVRHRAGSAMSCRAGLRPGERVEHAGAGGASNEVSGEIA